MKFIHMGMVMIASIHFNTLFSGDSGYSASEASDSDWLPVINAPSVHKVSNPNTAFHLGKKAAKGFSGEFLCHCGHQGHFDTNARHMHGPCFKPNQCIDCRKEGERNPVVLKTLQEAVNHVKDQHSSNKYLTCFSCGAKTIGVEGLADHVGYYVPRSQLPTIFKGWQGDPKMLVTKKRMPLDTLLKKGGISKKSSSHKTSSKPKKSSTNKLIAMANVFTSAQTQELAMLMGLRETSLFISSKLNASNSPDLKTMADLFTCPDTRVTEMVASLLKTQK